MKEKRYEAAYAGFVYEAPATHWTPSTVVRQRLTKMDFTKPDGIELGGMPIISDGQTALQKRHTLPFKAVVPATYIPTIPDLYRGFL